MTYHERESTISGDEIMSELEAIATTNNCNECKIRNCKWGTRDHSQEITTDIVQSLVNCQKIQLGGLMIKFATMHGMTNSFKVGIEKLEDYATVLSEILVSQMKLLRLDSAARSEAYETFVKNLKEWFDSYYDDHPNVDFYKFVDNLLKEMVGEE